MGRLGLGVVIGSVFLLGCPSDTTSVGGTEGSDSSTGAATTGASISATSNGSSGDGVDGTSTTGGLSSSGGTDSGTSAVGSSSDSGTTTGDSTSSSGTSSQTDTGSATSTGSDTDNGTSSSGGAETMGMSSTSDGETGFSLDVLNPVCDLFAQDCNAGDKCMPYDDEAAGTWTTTGCFEIDPSPAQPGDVCDAPGGGTAGTDTCDIGSMCWEVDDVTEEGVCVAMCNGPAVNPPCDDPATSCVIANDGLIVLCLPTCDPILQDCAGDQGCYPVSGGFNCLPHDADNSDEEGDTCEFLNGCAPGLVCIAADAYGAACAGGACCSPACDTDLAPNCPEVIQECVSWFEEGAAPPGLEDVGVCAVPV